MFLLDTNVLSEMLRLAPSPAVLAWLDHQERSHLYLNTITMAEVLEGIALLPHGKRRTALNNAYTLEIFPLFGDRILSFDRSAAEILAHLNTQARAAGRRVEFADSLIGAMAASRAFTVVTRDTAPFHAMGLTVIDPWTT